MPPRERWLCNLRNSWRSRSNIEERTVAALEHVRLGIETYEDSDEFKHDAPLEPIRAEIKKLLRGKTNK